MNTDHEKKTNRPLGQAFRRRLRAKRFGRLTRRLWAMMLPPDHKWFTLDEKL